MKIRAVSSAMVLLALAATGCASPDQTTNPSANEERAAPVYRTGSHIPIRDPQPQTKEERDKQAQAAQEMLESMRRTGAGIPQK